MHESNAMSGISRQTVQRLPVYYNLFRTLRAQGEVTVSSPAIARALGLNEVQVRKDLASVSHSGGRPRTGFQLEELMAGIEQCLGYNSIDEAVLVGVGRLGRAMLAYDGFEDCGVRIVAAFDKGSAQRQVDGKPVFPVDRLEELCYRLGVRIGIIAVPAAAAQEVCDLLVKIGVLAVWNFAPVHLEVPEGIMVQNENLAASLALLSKRLQQSGDEAAEHRAKEAER